LIVLAVIGILLFRRHRHRLQQDLPLSDYLEDKVTPSAPVELFAHPELDGQRIHAAELPGHEVAREMLSP
jgi:hypothetical protein